MRFAVRHAWLQKHPSPSNAAGDFHWHPADAPAALRNRVAELAMRAGGDAAVWVVSADSLVWARSFSAVAPADRRRYTGIVMTVAEGAAAATASPALLPALRLPPAQPFGDGGERGGDAPDGLELDLSGSRTSVSQPDGAALRAVFGAAAEVPGEVASVLLDGGEVTVARPTDDALPALVGAMLGWLGEAARARPRSAVFTTGVIAAAATLSPGARALRHYLGRSWFAPPAALARDPDYPRRVWAAVEELAASSSLGLDTLFDQLAELAQSWDDAAGLERLLLRSGTLTSEEIAACDARAPAPLAAAHVVEAGWLWSRAIHYWGRGLLERAPNERGGRADLGARLARLLARRVVMDHLFHLDVPEQAGLPRRYLRRLVFESLLPRARVAALQRELGRLMPSLLGPGGPGAATSGRVDSEVALG